jgi:primase-like protein/bifunctional DNA primase/polymerase-like protein
VSTTLDATFRYRDRGWKAIPLIEKRPIGERWADRKYSVGDFRNNNVGVILGSWSNGLVDVDLDCAEAVELADRYLPVTNSVFGRASKPRSHRLYRATGAMHEVFADPLAESKKVMLELRSDTASGAARFTMFPGSTHPSGEKVEWDSDGEPRTIAAAQLRLACAWLAVGCMVLRYINEWVDGDPARDPTLAMPRAVWSAWPAVAKPIYQWLGLPNTDEDARRRRKIPADVDVRELVAMIVNDLDRETWVKAGMAIYACGADYSTFLGFSRRSPTHHNVRTVERVWRSFQKSRPRSVGIGTLRYLAKGGR